jgi:hypothetical protein
MLVAAGRHLIKQDKNRLLASNNFSQSFSSGRATLKIARGA